jgi:hypothetical protein
MERVSKRAVHAFIPDFSTVFPLKISPTGSYSVRNFDEPQGGFLPPGEAGACRAFGAYDATGRSYCISVESLGVSQQVDEEERLLLAAAAPTTTEEMHPKALMTTNSIPVILGVRRIHIHNEEDAIDRALEASHASRAAFWFEL